MPALGTQGLFNFENNLLDSSGLGRTLVAYSGVVPFSSTPTPPQGTYWGGDFSGNSLRLADDSTNAMRAKDFWVVETYINMSSVVDANVLWCSYTTQNRVQMDGGGTVIALVLNGATISSPFAFVVGTTYLITASYDGTTRKLFVDGVLVASGLGGGTWDVDFAPASPTVIGDFIIPVGIQFRGKMDILRFMAFNSAGDVPTSFPVVDPLTNPAQLGMRRTRQ